MLFFLWKLYYTNNTIKSYKKSLASTLLLRDCRPKAETLLDFLNRCKHHSGLIHLSYNILGKKARFFVLYTKECFGPFKYLTYNVCLECSFCMAEVVQQRHCRRTKKKWRYCTADVREMYMLLLVNTALGRIMRREDITGIGPASMPCRR